MAVRPALLNSWFASASGLKGVGERIEKLLVRLLHPALAHAVATATTDRTARMVDLLFHVPATYVDRRQRVTVGGLPQDGIVTVALTIDAHRPPPPGGRRQPWRVEAHDATGELLLVFFHSHGDYISKLLPEGSERIVSGTVAWYGGVAQIAHPDHVVTPDQIDRLPLLEPVYPLTEGLSGKVYAGLVAQARARVSPLPEWQDGPWLAAQGWPDFAGALARLHAPDPALAPPGFDDPARLRLAFDEFLANQLALALVRRNLTSVKGRILSGPGEKRARILAALPYALTQSQRRALDEILADMASGDRMLRLLQGDVGSGKTIVALLALASGVEAGVQGAFMVPTDVLARQHHGALAALAEAAGLRLALLTGREKGEVRARILEDLAAGTIDILIGTHAIFQDNVVFQDLGLVVIDEQHRFGVHQRLALQARASRAPELLVMTATPIPRTLSLTLYGDMAVSKLTEKPAGRKPVATRAVPLERIEEVFDGLARLIARGEQAFWVCPLVEENEILAMAAAQQRAAFLEARFPGQVGLVHGQLKGRDKDEVMARFRAGAFAILVATTVIEVGVDVPRATAIIIENAERFGLAQLHQLRGRVGRGDAAASAILLYQAPLGLTAKARLKILRDTDDGFLIAEEDLRLRGAGEALGSRQSGLPEFRFGDVETQGELLQAARDMAGLVLARDPELASPQGEALRILLYLFERNEALRLLRSG